ncbi:beta-secretase 1-like [Gigantopelta aegis]|uniref:beta-secretase 1-like n=1 Tax=Gigantopelta aegis TaxID=1735272 RepID=UPI001B889C15|nr:beta-secretase 1-like [Gigantopelta aegis]
MRMEHCSFLVKAILSLCAVICQGEVMRIPLKGGTADYVVSSWVGGRTKRSSEQRNNLIGRSGEGYYMEVEIGTPPQKLNILVDTGSANFAVAASEDPDITRYFTSERSTTYEESGTTVYVPYTQGDWEGILGTDLVTIPAVVNVTVRSHIAFITKSSNFYINTSDWQGIMGLAFQAISRPDSSVVPYFDTLVQEGHVKDQFSMQLCGASLPFNTSYSMMSGTMVMGDISPDLYTGEVLYTPIYKEWYYEVVITDVHVAGTSLSLDCKEYNFDKTIVDSGTTSLRFPTKVFKAIVAKISGSLLLQEFPSEYFWTGEEIQCWSSISIPLEAFPVVTVSLQYSDHSVFKLHLSPQHYLRAVADPSLLDEENSCFKFGIASSNSGTVIGAVLMEAFYVVFNRINKSIGFANTTCVPKHTSGAPSYVEGPFTTESALSACAYVKPVKDNTVTLIVAYVMTGVCIVGFLPLAVVAIYYKIRRHRDKKQFRSLPDSENLVTDNH